MKKYIMLPGIIMLTAALSFSGCSLLKKRVDKTESQEFKINSAGKHKVYLTNTNGDLTVKKSDNTEIRITAEKKSKVRYDEKDKPLENITINIDTTGDIVTIKTDIRNNNGMFKKGRGGEVNYVIYLPAGLSLDIESTNGDMNFSDVSGDIKLDLVNSDVSFSHCTGYTNVKLINGDVTGNFDSTMGVAIETVNGSIKLGSLKNISAKFDVETEHGKVKYDGLTLTEPSSNRLHLYGTQNDGKAEIKIRAIHGSIKLSGTEVRLAKKSTDHFQFNFDFDDDDNEIRKQPSETKIEKKSLDSVKTTKPVDTTKAK